jgi:hypothetical protein
MKNNLDVLEHKFKNRKSIIERQIALLYHSLGPQEIADHVTRNAYTLSQKQSRASKHP